MIRAVLFDMDGVLVDTEWFYSRRREAYLAECGITYDVFPDLTGISTAETWEVLIPNDLGLRERLCEAYGPYCDAHPIPYSELLNDGVRDTFRQLHERGIKTAIASSSYRDMIEEVISVAGIRGIVDYVISGFECNAFKPDPEIYARAMSYLRVEPSECLVVEDSPTGIESGVRSGARVLALRPRDGVVLDQSRADKVIDTLGAIMDEL